MKRVKRFLKSYTDWPIDDFGPDELHCVQVRLIQYRYERDQTVKRYTRGGVNETINWTKRIWKWGLGRRLVRAEHVQGLEEIKALRMGRAEAPDRPKRRRVTAEEFETILRHVGSVVADMLRIIWLTGMRPGEVCGVRPSDILFEDEDCWLYVPGRDQSPLGHHKTVRFERVKVIPLTRECQNILKPRMATCGPKDYIFNPRESMREFYARKGANRRTPLRCGNRPGSNRKENPMIKPGVKYSHDGLRHTCQRACKTAGVEAFSPYDLRRTTATRVRREDSWARRRAKRSFTPFKAAIGTL